MVSHARVIDHVRFIRFSVMSQQWQINDRSHSFYKQKVGSEGISLAPSNQRLMKLARRSSRKLVLPAKKPIMSNLGYDSEHTSPKKIGTAAMDTELGDFSLVTHDVRSTCILHLRCWWMQDPEKLPMSRLCKGSWLYGSPARYSALPLALRRDQHRQRLKFPGDTQSFLPCSHRSGGKIKPLDSSWKEKKRSRRIHTCQITRTTTLSTGEWVC